MRSTQRYGSRCIIQCNERGNILCKIPDHCYSQKMGYNQGEIIQYLFDRNSIANVKAMTFVNNIPDGFPRSERKTAKPKFQ